MLALLAHHILHVSRIRVKARIRNDYIFTPLILKEEILKTNIRGSTTWLARVTIADGEQHFLSKKRAF